MTTPKILRTCRRAMVTGDAFSLLKRAHLFPLLMSVLFTGCTADEHGTSSDGQKDTAPSDSTAITGELAYLSAYDGKYANQDGVFLTEPFNERLKALMGAWHTRFLGDLDVQGPVSARNGTVVISGCRAHNCDTHGSIVVVDLRSDNILAGHRIDNRISVFSEHPLDTARYPADLLHWAGDDPISPGSMANAPKPAKSTGAFVWVDLGEASEGALTALKKMRTDVRRSMLDELRADAKAGCEVRVTEYDLDGNGQPGILVSRSGCMDWCGSAGCNISVYEGGRLRLSVNDEADLLKPGKNGVISSKGVLLKLN